MFDKDRIELMTKLAMMEDENPGISDSLPSRSSFMGSRVFACVVANILIFLFILFGYMLVAYLNPKSLISSAPTIYFIVISVLFILLLAVEIIFIRKYANMRYSYLKTRQKEYKSVIKKISDSYESESD